MASIFLRLHVANPRPLCDRFLRFIVRCFFEEKKNNPANHNAALHFMPHMKLAGNPQRAPRRTDTRRQARHRRAGVLPQTEGTDANAHTPASHGPRRRVYVRHRSPEDRFSTFAYLADIGTRGQTALHRRLRPFRLCRADRQTQASTTLRHGGQEHDSRAVRCVEPTLGEYE